MLSWHKPFHRPRPLYAWQYSLQVSTLRVRSYIFWLSTPHFNPVNWAFTDDSISTSEIKNTNCIFICQKKMFLNVRFVLKIVWDYNNTFVDRSKWDILQLQSVNMHCFHSYRWFTLLYTRTTYISERCVGRGNLRCLQMALFILFFVYLR